MASSEDAFSIFVGIDWGSESHQVCVMDGSRKVLLEKAFAHSGKGLGELVDAVLHEAAGHAERVAVAIEVPRGAIVDTLLEKDIAVFAINPKQLDRFAIGTLWPVRRTIVGTRWYWLIRCAPMSQRFDAYA